MNLVKIKMPDGTVVPLNCVQLCLGDNDFGNLTRSVMDMVSIFLKYKANVTSLEIEEFIHNGLIHFYKFFMRGEPSTGQLEYLTKRTQVLYNLETKMDIAGAFLDVQSSTVYRVN